jgi:hypothetical protein
MKKQIQNKEFKNLFDGKEVVPKYTSFVINQACEWGSGTHDSIVGFTTLVIKREKPGTTATWKNRHSALYPEGRSDGVRRTHKMFKTIRTELQSITIKDIRAWWDDFVYAKTFRGFRMEVLILRELGKVFGKDTKSGTLRDEKKGIDGYIGRCPVSIKPSTYRKGHKLQGVLVKYRYMKKADRVEIDYDHAKIRQQA